MTCTEATRVFEVFERTNSKPAEYSEKQFEFLNRSARKRDARIRERLESGSLSIRRTISTN